MEIKRSTKIVISKRPGPTALLIETTPFALTAQGDEWVGRELVIYRDSSIDVLMIIRGQKGQEYEMTLTLNDEEKEIKGTLEKNGNNRITKQFRLSSFIL